MPALESPWENARRELPFHEGARGFSVILKRNCSISPAGLACVFAALGVAALAIGAGFALAGAWLILPFAGLEVLLLTAAFLLQARHATDYERIELDRGRLAIEVAQAGRVVDGAGDRPPAPVRDVADHRHLRRRVRLHVLRLLRASQVARPSGGAVPREHHR